MKHNYKTKGTCAREIEFELDGNVVRNVIFYGGCNGNLKAIAKLAEGQSAEQLVKILRGNTCGPRSTSCADQFAIAITEALAKENA